MVSSSKAPCPRPWISTEVSPCCGFDFAPSLPRLKDGLGETFDCFLQLDVLLVLTHNLAPTGDIVLYQMLVQRVGDHSPLINARADASSLQLCTLASLI